MTTRKVRFTLRDWETELALAFERHCRINLGIEAPLDELVKRQFLNWLSANVDRGEEANGKPELGVSGGDTSPSAVGSQDVASSSQEEPQADAGPYTAAP